MAPRCTERERERERERDRERERERKEGEGRVEGVPAAACAVCTSDKTNEEMRADDSYIHAYYKKRNTLSS